MTDFNFLTTGKQISINLHPKQKSFVPPWDAEEQNNPKKDHSRIKYDVKSINLLQKILEETIIFHKDFLSENLPPKIEVEFLRVKRTEQIIHNFNTNKIAERYAESSQIKEGRNTPKISISSDFVKDFDYVDIPSSGHIFIDELRKNISNSLPLKTYFKGENNVAQIKRIMLEITFLHEVGHIIFDSKIKDTFLKNSYSFFEKDDSSTEEKRLKGDTLRSIIRCANEGFSDGIASHLTQTHYKDHDILLQYKKVREATSKSFEDNISSYNVLGVLGEISNLKGSNSEIVNKIFLLSLSNAIKITEEKLNSSTKFTNLLANDFTYLSHKGCLSYDRTKTEIDNLKDNFSHDLQIPINLLCPKLNKQTCFNNISNIRNKFLNESNQGNHNKTI